MQRVLVIGCGGAGKTTLARRIAELADLPLIHLDALYWRPGWQATPNEEWDQTVGELVARDAWVMDGNYGRTLDVRLAACDTVIFLDMPRYVCLWRVFRRWLQYRKRTRPDLAPGCPEHVSWEFVRWIWTYPQRRPGVLERIRGLRGSQRFVWLKNARDIEDFCKSLP